jgi:hypothetical protein
MTIVTFDKYPVVLIRNQGKTLQSGFLKGMEQLLGVTYDASKHKTHEDWVESRIQTVEADALDQAEGDNKARTRYQRMFWEPVVEGTVRVSFSFLIHISSKHLTSLGSRSPQSLKKGTRRCYSTRTVRGVLPARRCDPRPNRS